MKLVIATSNPHKLTEMRAILNIRSLELVDLSAYPNLPPVIEDGATFVSNATKKAVITALATREWALADDSGLEVDFLNGAPGVYSARYAGEPVDYRANNAKLLAEMKNAMDRKARFCCVVALSSPAGMAQVVEGYCEGRIIHEPRGTGGFGYDPLFVPEGYDLTFAELGSSVKNGISHRSKALSKAQAAWHGALSSADRDWPGHLTGQR